MGTPEPRAPWREVLPEPAPRWWMGRGSVLGPDTSRRTRVWHLHLSCGHKAVRTVRYRPEEGATRGGTQHRRSADVLPPPKRVRCDECHDAGGPDA